MPTATAEAPVAERSGTSTPARLVAAAHRSVPASSFVAFRVAFGLLVTFGQIRFLARGWVDEFYLAPEHHLTYPGFGWVAPLPAPAMYAVTVGLAVLGVLIAVGVRPRLSAALFTLGFAYCELIDAALYLNHYWFVTLAGLLLAVLPAPDGGRVPAFDVWALRAQLGVVYFFAGLAKLNADWLWRAEPLHTWLSARTDRPLVGPWLDEPVVALAVGWAGAAFDLTIVAWLLWRRTRPGAYVVLVVFHLATAALFQIGVFPWVMIAATPIFFAPDWPARVRSRLGVDDRPLGPPGESTRRTTRTVAIALSVLAMLNVALPLRHYAAEGNVRWNDDGYLLSWRVLLTERSSRVTFDVVDARTGRVREVVPTDVLDEWQAAAATTRADLILATAHLVGETEADLVGHDDVEVYADVFVAWNGRLRERWIDPDVDLMSVSRLSPASTFVLDHD